MEGAIFQFGIPPNRIDFLNKINGVTFESAWPNRTIVVLNTRPETTPFSYIGLEDLIKNKRAAGRPKDLDDLAFLTTVLGSKQEE